MDRAAWLDAFVMHMSKLGSRARPATLLQMAKAYWHLHGKSDPVKVAQWRADEFGVLHED